jgi:hypothetical protein
MGCTILFKRWICRDSTIHNNKQFGSWVVQYFSKDGSAEIQQYITTNNLVHGFQEYKQTIWFMGFKNINKQFGSWIILKNLFLFSKCNG